MWLLGLHPITGLPPAYCTQLFPNARLSLRYLAADMHWAFMQPPRFDSADRLLPKCPKSNLQSRPIVEVARIHRKNKAFGKRADVIDMQCSRSLLIHWTEGYRIAVLHSGRSLDLLKCKLRRFGLHEIQASGS